MTSPGPNRKRWMDRFSTAMAPVTLEDDGKPILRPRTIDVAFVLLTLGAILLLFTGGALLAQMGKALDTYGTQYKQFIAQCDNSLGGFGTVVPTTASPNPPPTSGDLITDTTQLVQLCNKATSPVLTDSDRGAYKNQIVVASVISLVLGIGAAVGAWFFRSGTKWARRLLVAVVLLCLLDAFLIGSSVFSLLATLLMVVGLVLSYMGKGSIFFARVALRKANQRR